MRRPDSASVRFTDEVASKSRRSWGDDVAYSIYGTITSSPSRGDLRMGDRDAQRGAKSGGIQPSD